MDLIKTIGWGSVVAVLLGGLIVAAIAVVAKHRPTFHLEYKIDVNR
jgi:uncharacterized membrane protein YczE